MHSVPTEDNLPETLYHATFAAYLPSIRMQGLHGNAGHPNYDFSEAGVVYLARHPEIARSYAEISETVPDSYLDQICVLHIKTAGLRLSLLTRDPNVIDGTDTWEYRGTIEISTIEEGEGCAA